MAMNHELLNALETVWGRGFLSPFGSVAGLRELVGDVELEGKTVLDFGCGYGGFSRLFATSFGAKSVIGVDRDRLVLERAAEWDRKARDEGLPTPTFHLMADATVPVADASVDVVFAKEVFLYVEDKAPLFAELYRTIRPGGTFVLVDFTRRDDEPGPRMREFCEFEDAFLPVAIGTLKALRDALDRAGFEETSHIDASEIFLLRSIREEEMLQSMSAEDVRTMGEAVHRVMMANWRSTLGVLRSGELRMTAIILSRPSAGRGKDS